MVTGITGLSVFFPAYNDAPSLPALIEATFATVPQVTGDFEVIVVNDGSQDDTDQVLLRLCARYGPRLRVVRHAVNQGYGGAVRSGLQAAKKDWVFYTDGDGQYDVTELPRLVEALRPGVGLVNGYKTSRSDVFYRIWIGKTYLWTVRRLFRLKTRDVDCDFRLIRRSLLQGLTLESTSGTICVELVRRLQDTGCAIIEVPVRHLPRLHGRSQFFRPMNLVKSVWQLAGLYVRLLGQRKCAAPQVVCDTE
jgi:glycosyltransferase involved in cell wall biosynthesis